MRSGQNFYYAQHQQQAAQGNSGFRPGHQHQQQHQQQNPAFLSSLYAGPHDLRSGVQVVTLPIGAVAQQFTVTPLPPPQQWGHIRSESQPWGNGNFPHQGLGPPFHGQQFPHHEPNVPFIPPPHLGGDGVRGNPSWGYGHDGPNGRFDRPMHQDLRRPADGMRQMDYLPHERSSRGPSRDKSYDDSRSGSWSNGSGSSNSRNISGGRNGKGRGGGGGMDREPVRPQAVSLRCEPCDRTLTNAQQFAAHKSTHVKCDVKGCSFEASGRVVKEHKQTSHDNSSSSAPSRPGLFKSKESEEEVLRWRDERRRNYPTTANMKHKAEEMVARKARGELVDEDARKRRERLKEILARQAELGVPVAELPAYYLSDRYGGPKGKGDNAGGGRKENNRSGKRRLNGEQANGATGANAVSVVSKEDGSEPPIKQARIEEFNPSASTELAPSTRESGAEGMVETKTVKAEPTAGPETEAVSAPTAGGKGKNSKQSCYFYRRGRCKKGNKCEFVHERSERPKKARKDQMAAAAKNKRQPTLLAKLLESDIRREKSHLLQSFRFFVNNMFLLEWPEKPLKFFDWTDIEDQTNSDAEVARIDKKLTEELEAVMEDTDDDEEDDEEDHILAPDQEDGNGESSTQVVAAQ